MVCAPTVCSIEGCPAMVHSRGWCRKHYARWLSNGSPLIAQPKGRFAYMRTPAAERFLGYVRKNGPVPRTAPHLGPCWLWTARINAKGYGQFSLDSRPMEAHRVAYLLFIGPIPEGFQVDHLCKTTACVCPDHLEAVTPRENVLRSDGPAAINARKTHCPKGHPYSGDNLYVSPDGKYRQCRTCVREFHARSAAALP